MLNILHVIPGLNNSSGPTHAVLNLARHTADRGHAVEVVHLSGRTQDIGGEPSSRLTIKSFPCTGLRHYGYSPELRHYLQRRIPRSDVVHIHSMWLYPTLVACQTARRSRVPYIIRPAGSLDPRSRGNGRLRKILYWHLVEKANFRNASVIHVLSSLEEKHVRAFSPDTPIATIPGAIDAPDLHRLPGKEEARSLLGLPPESPIVLYLGRLHPQKGLELLGQAFARLQQTLPQARLVIAGAHEHAYGCKLKRFLTKLGILDETYFLGEKLGNEKIATFVAADVFVLPSYSENFGFVVLESLAAGTPVVVSRHTPWADVEAAGAGCVMDLHPGEIAVKLLSILSSPDKLQEMRARGREFILARFNWARITTEMIGLYQRVSGGPNSA